MRQDIEACLDRVERAFILPSVVLYIVSVIIRSLNDVLKSFCLVAAQQHVTKNLNVTIFQLKLHVATRSPVENRLKILILKDLNGIFVFLAFDNSKFVEKGQFSNGRRSRKI